MRHRRRLAVDIDFWPGFTDVLSGMLLAMVFVLTVFAVTQAGLVSAVGGKDAALRELEEQLAELRSLLMASDDRSNALEEQLMAATSLVEELAEGRDAATSELAEEKVRLADLVRRLRDYTEQIKELNSRLNTAEELAENRRGNLANLQRALNQLRQQLAEMSRTLTTSEEEAAMKTVRLSELLAEMARKDRRIAELESLERYTSEFLAKMSEVFRDNPNIKVVGDRFVFQSEVLFASGSDQIGPAGRRELNKFVRAFRELMPLIPRDLDVNVQVQGHTDTDPLLGRGRFKNNWDLSASRALRVVEYLASRGLPNDMMSAAGFGEHAPRIRGSSAAAKTQNRRIEIRITRR